MVVKLNLIAAACQNMGIGKNGDLPWRLKKFSKYWMPGYEGIAGNDAADALAVKGRSEMAYFTKLTSQTKDPNKKNAVIMGRVSWDCIPPKFKPLKNRVNIILSRNSSLQIDDTPDVVLFNSLDKAIESLSKTPYTDTIEKVWVIGGSHIYKLAMESKYPCRLYLTRIMKDFECDTFFPEIPNNFQLVSDPEISEDIQEEKGVQFKYTVYEKQ